jgi:hypothetical protein
MRYVEKGFVYKLNGCAKRGTRLAPDREKVVGFSGVSRSGGLGRLQPTKGFWLGTPNSGTAELVFLLLFWGKCVRRCVVARFLE